MRKETRQSQRPFSRYEALTCLEIGNKNSLFAKFDRVNRKVSSSDVVSCFQEYWKLCRVKLVAKLLPVIALFVHMLVGYLDPDGMLAQPPHLTHPKGRWISGTVEFWMCEGSGEMESPDCTYVCSAEHHIVT